MDPNATLAEWREAVQSEDWDTAFDRGNDLRMWLRRGGFEPEWQPEEREVFFPAKERLR